MARPSKFNSILRQARYCPDCRAEGKPEEEERRFYRNSTYCMAHQQARARALVTPGSPTYSPELHERKKQRQQLWKAQNRPPRPYTKRNAAALLEVTPQTIKDWIGAGWLPSPLTLEAVQKLRQQRDRYLAEHPEESPSDRLFWRHVRRWKVGRQ